jgi:hypothetical protein
LTFGCYVYYRVRPGRQTEADALARALLQALASQWPVTAGLARKVDEPLLWMETYQGFEGDPAAFVAALYARADECGFSAVLPDGELRHVEVFECV